MQGALNEDEIFRMPAEELIERLALLCRTDIPATVETPEDVQTASRALGRLGPLYSYLVNMRLRANIRKRACKGDKEKKALYENALVKETILDAYVDQVKMLYSTASRLISVRQMINEELRHLRMSV